MAALRSQSADILRTGRQSAATNTSTLKTTRIAGSRPMDDRRIGPRRGEKRTAGYGPTPIFEEDSMPGITLGGALVIAGIIIAILWSVVLGVIVALVGLIAFGGFARGKWY